MTTAKPADEGTLATATTEAEQNTAFDEGFDAALKAETADVKPETKPATTTTTTTDTKPPDTTATPPSEEADAAKATVAPTETKAAPPADTKAEVKPDDKKPDPDTKPPDAEDENSQTYKQRWLVLQGIHKKEKEKLQREKEELEAKLTAANKPPPEPTPQPDKKPDAVQKLRDFLDNLTEDEKAEMKEYEQEFDVVAKMEGRKRTAALNNLRQEIMDELTKVRAQLEPAVKLVTATAATQEKLSEDTHFSALREAHPDFEQHRDNGSILAWIESKPRYLRPGLVETYTKGELEDVIELLNDFKKDNNIATSTQAPPDNVVKLDPKKAERKATMTPPNSRGTAVTTTVQSTDDYDGAFDEALRKQ